MIFGERLCELVAERHTSLYALSKIVPCDDSHLYRIAQGAKTPSRQLAKRLDDILNAGGELVALVPEKPSRRSAKRRLPGGMVGAGPPGHAEDDDEMRRRALLALLSGLGGSAFVSSGESGELPSRLVDLALTSEPRDIEDWQLACADHLYAVRTRPAHQVRDDLVLDLLALQRQLGAAEARDVVELQRVRAALSTLHANVLTRLGDHGSAIRWWRTARGAAEATGDRELGLLIRATEAGHGLYGQRDPETILLLTQNAQQIAGSSRSLGLALVTCSQAKALTLLGRHEEAKWTLNTYRDLAVAAPPPTGIMPGYWKGGQLHFAENMVHAGARDESAACQAGEHVMASPNPDYQVRVQVRLHEALCTVVNGGINQGLQQAAAVLDALPATHHSHMITETGRMVLRAVPLDRQQRPAVAEFRKVLTSTAPKLRALTEGTR